MGMTAYMVQYVTSDIVNKFLSRCFGGLCHSLQITCIRHVLHCMSNNNHLSCHASNPRHAVHLHAFGAHHCDSSSLCGLNPFGTTHLRMPKCGSMQAFWCQRSQHMNCRKRSDLCDMWHLCTKITV